MPTRPRPDAAARVHALLLSPAWTPPSTHPGGWVPAETAGGWTPAAPAPPSPPSPSAPPPPPAEPPARSGLARPPRVVRTRPEPAPAGATGGQVLSGVAERLPESVRELLASGRWDPGRRGVLALVGVALVAALVAGLIVMRGRPSEEPVAAPSAAVVAPAATATGGPDLVVDVAGKVRHPGLVHLPSGARVDDAIRAAGGVSPGVSTGTLNLAQKVADGQQVLVGEPAPTSASGGGNGPGALLDLNQATSQDFDALPGIGPVLADRIVAWRTAHGRFASVDQLREVSGIGESKFQQLRPLVQV